MAPTTSTLIEQSPNHLAEIARRVEQRRKELGLTQQQLAERCTQAREECFGRDLLNTVPKVSRDRIAKLIMAKGEAPGRSAAKALYPHELKLLAYVLKVPIEWLSGPDPERTIVVWDPLTEPHRAKHVLHLIGYHQGRAPDLLSWGEFLPPSLTTPELMHAYHAVIFGMPVPEGCDDAAAVVRLYDSICDASRQRTLRSVQARAQTFTHCMFVSDLSNIAAGERPYGSLGDDVRHQCLQHLADLIAENHLNPRLVVVEDTALPEVKLQLRGCDSLFVTGDALAMWRDHNGNLLWSEHPRIVRRKRQLLETLHTRARYRDVESVIRLLQHLMQSMRTKPSQLTERSKKQTRQGTARR